MSGVQGCGAAIEEERRSIGARTEAVWVVFPVNVKTFYVFVLAERQFFFGAWQIVLHL
jgi:hypothetical protein